MLKELRNQLSTLIFSTAKNENPFHWKNVPSDWGIHPKYPVLWKKVMDDEDLSIVGIMVQNIEDVEDQIHYHLATEYVTVIKGEIEIILPNKNIILKEGDSLTIPPKVPHYGRSKKDSIQLII